MISLDLGLSVEAVEEPIVTGSAFQHCRFCNGLGCICCPTERARMDAKPNGGFVPICALTEMQLKDPKVWEILRIFMHRDVVMRSKSAGNLPRREALKQLAQGKWGQPFLIEKVVIGIPRLMAYLKKAYGSVNPPPDYTGSVIVFYTVNTGVK